jgi:hypothetical protein
MQWVPGGLSLGVKWQGREADHSPPSSTEVKECVALYIHSPNKPSWRGAQLKHKDNFTFTFLLLLLLLFLLLLVISSTTSRVTCIEFQYATYSVWINIWLHANISYLFHKVIALTSPVTALLCTGWAITDRSASKHRNESKSYIRSYSFFISIYYWTDFERIWYCTTHRHRLS